MAGSIVDIIETALGRRDFLRKVTNVTGAFIGGLFGAPQLAYACYECCGLCKDPSTCTWNPSSCACVWCWVCKDSCNYWKCSECIITPFRPPCDASICKCWSTNKVDACRYCDPNFVTCSRVTPFGTVARCIEP
jgi:hypothetical protein